MTTEICTFEHAEHVALQGNVHLIDIHLLLARQAPDKARVAHDIVLDLSAANVKASAREISTFILYLAADLLPRLGARRITIVTGKDQTDFNWDTMGTAAIQELAADHERFDVVNDIASVAVDDFQIVAEPVPLQLTQAA